MASVRSRNTKSLKSTWFGACLRQLQANVRARKAVQRCIKEDPKERRAEVLVDVAEVRKSIRNARLSFANYKTQMTALRRPDGSITSSRTAMEKIIHDFYSNLFDSHVHLPTYQIPQHGYVVPNVLPSEIRHAISSVKKKKLTISIWSEDAHQSEFQFFMMGIQMMSSP